MATTTPPMSFATQPVQPPNPMSSPTYSTPSNSDLAAVAATVSVVGVLMALLITWLAIRLRQASQANDIPIAAPRPTSNASYIFRPSFAPSEASSKFSFARKPLRLSRRRQEPSWDFADPDPFSHSKESPHDPPPAHSPSQKHRPAPLAPTPAYTPRAHKDELVPWTPTTPGTPASIESPPPVYCRETGAPWSVYQPMDVAPP